MASIKVDKFIGLYTRLYRGNRPIGSLDNMENFVLNQKVGKLVQRSGYTADINGNITDVSGATTLSTFDKLFIPSSELPESKDYYIICGKASGVPKFFQKPFYWNSDTATNSYFDWNEQFTGTISSKSTNTFVITGAGQTDDYYKNFSIFKSGTALIFYVTGYTSSTETFTVMPDITSTLSNGDTVILARAFHDNPYSVTNLDGMVPTWVTPCVLKQGDNIVASGGQSSNAGCRPIWSGYLNKTYFPSSTPATFQGTYVTEAEIKQSLDSVFVASSTSNADGLPAAYYSVGVSYQTDDGQRGPLKRVSEVLITTGNAVSLVSTVWIGSLNKRIRFINVYLSTNPSSTATPDWSTYLFVGQIDLLATGWVFTQTSGAVRGFHAYTFVVTNAIWNSRGSDAATHVGFTETTSYTRSFSLGVITAGRLFVGLTYDYANSTYDYDSIFYSPFNGSGASSYNVLPNIQGFLQSTIEAGDPDKLTALAYNESFLVIAKTRGIYYIDLTASPTTWILTNVTKELGCNATYTMHTTPYGIVWANGGDDVYMFRGGKPESMMKNYLVDYRALSTTYVSQWVGWYDPARKVSCIMVTTDGTTFKTIYELEFEVATPNSVSEAQSTSFTQLDSFAIVKHITTDNVCSVARRSDGIVFFSTGANKTFYWDTSNPLDGSTAIGGYFKMNGIVVTEKDFVAFLEWYIAMEPSGTTAGSLDIIVYGDGNSLQGLSALTATGSYLRTKIPPAGSTYGNLARKFGIGFNTNSTRATWAISLIINEVGLEVDERPLIGDKRQSL